MMKLNNYRKGQLSDLARTAITEYCPNQELPDLNIIAKNEGISIIYDHYDRSFEGMTICSNGQFFIHIDLDLVKDQNSGRNRFTLAHELGHVLIDEHRVGLLSHNLEPHSSDYLLGNNDKLIELEADYFASALLMPEDIFRKKAGDFSNPFSFETIKKLSSYFNTSILATLLRFSEIGSEAVLCFFAKDGKVKWFVRSTDFPAWPFRFKVGTIPPENTVLGDYLRNNSLKYTEVEQVDIDAWFYPKWDIGLKLFEQCIYVNDYDYAISMLWFSK